MQANTRAAGLDIKAAHRLKVGCGKRTVLIHTWILAVLQQVFYLFVNFAQLQRETIPVVRGASGQMTERMAATSPQTQGWDACFLSWAA